MRIGSVLLLASSWPITPISAQPPEQHGHLIDAAQATYLVPSAEPMAAASASYLKYRALAEQNFGQAGIDQLNAQNNVGEGRPLMARDLARLVPLKPGAGETLKLISPVPSAVFE